VTFVTVSSGGHDKVQEAANEQGDKCTIGSEVLEGKLQRGSLQPVLDRFLILQSVSAMARAVVGE
jgi:hypothetical protein